MHPSRRSVVRSAAWAVPAVTVAAATPAFAASGVKLAFTAGATDVVVTPSNTHDYYDLRFRGVSVEVTGQPAPDTVLTLVVTFVATIDSDEFAADNPLYSHRLPEAAEELGWSETSMAGQIKTLSFVFPVSGPTTIPLADGVWIGLAESTEILAGRFILTFSLTGATSVTATFDTPPIVPAAAPAFAARTSS